MPIVIKRKVAAPPPEPVAQKPVKAQVEPLDGMCRVALEASPNAAIAWWLMASYLYYHHDISILSDGFYDELAKAMLEAWDELEHQHKYLITTDNLRIGSLFNLAADAYPMRVRGGASHLAANRGFQIDIRH